MRTIRSIPIIVLGLLFGVGLSTVEAVKPEDNRVTRERGKRLYDQSCLFCHGSEGKGDGPAGWSLGRYQAPHPRDFTGESYKFRSTPTGELPTDQDLFRTLTQGIPGYMPSFGGLSEEERWQVVAYVKSFNPLFKEEKPRPIIVPIPPAPPTEAGIENGRHLYLKYGCHSCHGDNGYGDGSESLKGNLKDTRGLTISAGDLTERASLKNGSSPGDIYRSLMTGLDGTPMPSYADTFAGKERDVWDLIYYILSLSQERR